MRVARWFVLVCLVSLLAVAAPRLAAETPSIVVGEGNALCGRVDVLWLGAADAPFAAAVERLAAEAAPRGLTVASERRERLGGELPTAAVVAVAWPPTQEDATVLRRFADVGRGVVVFVDAELGAVASRLGSDDEPLEGAAAVQALDPRSIASWGARPQIRAFAKPGKVPHVVAAAPATDLRALALTVLRHSIARARGVRHLPSAFGRVESRREGDALVVSAEPLIAGTVAMDVVTVDGAVVLPEGPPRPVPLALVRDPAATLVRFRFEGEGVRDEMRLWFADVDRGRLADVRVEGLSTARAGGRAVYRVVATDADGAGLDGCGVEAKLGDAAANARTDATGAAIVTFPSVAAGAESTAELSVVVRGAFADRRLATPIGIEAGSEALALESDRPVHRAGGVVKLRAIVLDAAERPAMDRDVVVRVTDPRRRLVRTFGARSDEFGAAAFEMPLAARVAEGAYEAEATCGVLSSKISFRVEAADRLPFDVRVEVGGRRVALGASLNGTIVVRDWDGVPLTDVAVRIEVNGSPSGSMRGDGPIAFDALAPSRAGPATLCVVVEHDGRAVRSESTIEVVAEPASDGFTVEAPETIEPGSTLAVEVRAPPTAGIFDVDLVGRGGILASTSVVAVAGRAHADLAVPADGGGPAVVVARRRDTRDAVRRTVAIARPGLSVSIEVPDSAAPGADVEAAVRVADPNGHAVAALLDARGVDRAHGAHSSCRSKDPRARRDDESIDGPRLLVSDNGLGAWYDLEVRSNAAARETIDRAVLDVARDGRTEAVLPWGARCFAGDVGGALAVVAAGPVTRVVGGPAERSSGRIVARVPAREPGDAFAELLPRRFDVVRLPPANVAGNVVWTRRWLPVHQSIDGSFHPSRFLDLCDRPGCDEPGPPEFHVASTALALLCFLGAGETHQSGTMRETVKTGLAWLRRNQAPDGFVGRRDSPSAALNHAFAALALTEAFGMTGSRVFKAPAESAIATIVALQRPDGSYAESEMTEGSVILGTFCLMAMGDAVLSEIDFDRGAMTRYGAWLDAHSDAATGAPSLSREEIATYPFGGTSPARTAAGAAFLTRVHLGQKPETSASMRLELATLVAQPPGNFVDEDLLAVYFGTLATFHAGADVWKQWNAGLKTCVIDHQDWSPDSCARGSWPATDGLLGRMLSTELCCLAMEVYYRYGRVLGSADGDRGGAPEDDVRVRSEFPDLMVSDLAVRTDERGGRTLRLRVPDQITTWDLDLGAWDREGRYGRATASIRSSLPLFATIGLPPRLRPGDKVRVPVTVRSTLEADAECVLELTRTEGIRVVEPPPSSIRLAAGATASVELVCEALGPDSATIEARVSGGGRTDAVRATAAVSGTGFPFARSVAVTVGEEVSLPASESTDARALLSLRGSVLGAATSSLAGLIRRPTGCFEQTSATLRPAALAWRRLGADRTDPRIEFLRQGYQRLLTFEAQGGGFAPFDGRDPQGDLTALAIHELLDLDPIVPVDRAVLRRARDFLWDHLPTEPAALLVALGAVKRVGTLPKIELPDLGREPYLLALASTQGLLDPAASVEADEVLAATAEQDGRGGAVWRSRSVALARGRPASDVETTALAVQALARSPGREALVRVGLETLRRSIGPDGAWSTTRETVAALQALDAAATLSATGTIVVAVDGRPAAKVALGADEVEIDLGRWTGKEALTVRFDGDGVPWATLCVRGSRPTADAASAPPPMTLSVAWPTSTLAIGSRATARVGLRNETPQSVTAPLVVIPLPGGVAVDLPALERRANAAGFPFVEIEGGSVRLYATSLEPRATLSVDIAFTARHAGTFATGAAAAYPYYEPDETCWTPSVAVVVGR